ncbi:MAG TPA: FAD-binding oxidoreductase [Polyangiaceae bacterium]|nr:FAD-binding oxidoreductase [Polyangiaceae bacterium]
MSAIRTRSFWHWGFEEEFPDEQARRALAQQAAFMVPGAGELSLEPLPSLEGVELPAARIAVPHALSAFTTDMTRDRILHAAGKGYRDVLRAFRRDFRGAPDLVAYPENEEHLAALFELCAREGAALVPFGGGTSVVSGVTYEGPPRPVVSVDLGRLDQLLEVDGASRLVRLRAGASGPRLEAQLAEHGLSLRFFPQSFELSTLGGWIATRAGGHFATGYTHIDDLVAGLRMLTPAGAYETRTLPASGAGPDPNRWVLGSEGTLGVVTEATLRAFVRPVFRASATVMFATLERAAAAARGIAQAYLWPSNCRVLDPAEALLSGVSGDGRCALLLGFESADHELESSMERALKIAVRAGGATDGARYRRGGEKARGDRGGAETYRAAFLRGPYLQSALVSLGVLVDTFETACTWSRFEALDREVRAALAEAMAPMGGGLVSLRFSHVYPDGPAPYYTFGVRAQRGRELEQHEALKRAASDALSRTGGTITHHHAVGRLHRPWYDRERPELFARALGAAKRELDPAGIMNPGVLILPHARAAGESSE